MTANHFQGEMFASVISSISMDLAECCHGQKGHSWMHCQQRANLLQSTWSVKDGGEKNIQRRKMISSVKSKGKKEEEIQRTPLKALDSKGSTRGLGYQEPEWDGNTKGSLSWAWWGADQESQLPGGWGQSITSLRKTCTKTGLLGVMVFLSSVFLCRSSKV